ncbi:putative PPE family protein PPE51 [Mycobacterium simulans]|uniref:Putative PPE family protein PPE51 n=1 Tax=Mycobacterium simulans TaxID=627089 RepID=A0A7Z7IMB0_9MYCO|nr:PPE family protein [Mycobacterium simulans]SOJ54847.1 putative PPE family protein PPE51 [Mycobacterium simulans]
MLTDFAMLPPEINSGLMYAGPGSGSLRAAAASWAQVSAELQSTAEIYRSVISDLASCQWLGPSSVSMAAAVTPYVEWLEATSAQAQQTALQATAAARGFELAFEMTVPPAIITANRTQLLWLNATNFFGQNSTEIAAAEFAYAQMWITDAIVMHDYAGTSVSAITLTPFTSPQQTTDPAGLPAQTAAVTNAAAGAVADDGNWIGNLLIEIGTLLLPIAPELTPFFVGAGEFVNALPFPSLVKDDFTFLDGIMAWYATVSSINNINSMGTGIIGAEKNLGILPNLAAPAVEAAPTGLAPLASSVKALSDAVSKGGFGTGLGEVSAGLRRAGWVGQLSVPPSWTTPTVTTVRALQGTPMTTLPAGDSAAPGMPGMPGVAAAGTGRAGVVPRYGVTPRVMSRPLAGG